MTKLVRIYRFYLLESSNIKEEKLIFCATEAKPNKCLEMKLGGDRTVFGQAN